MQRNWLHGRCRFEHFTLARLFPSTYSVEDPLTDSRIRISLNIENTARGMSMSYQFRCVTCSYRNENYRSLNKVRHSVLYVNLRDCSAALARAFLPPAGETIAWA